MKDAPLFTALIAAGALCCFAPLLAPLLLGAASLAAMAAWAHAAAPLLAAIVVLAPVALWLRHSSRRGNSDVHEPHESV